MHQRTGYAAALHRCRDRAPAPATAPRHSATMLGPMPARTSASAPATVLAPTPAGVDLPTELLARSGQ